MATGKRNNGKGSGSGLPPGGCDTFLMFAETLSALKGRLVKKGIYEALRASFVNLALNVTIENLKTLPRDAWQAARMKFLGSYFDMFEFGEHPREFYGSPENFDYIELFKSGADPLVSVVVPVYNVEKYLCECLDSLLAQVYWNIEVICVNDGSSDSSADILASYAEKFAAKGIRYVVRWREHGGPGSARNTGIPLAKGKYIYFLDSDDYILPTAMLELCALAEREGLDEILFSAKTIGDLSEVSQEKIDSFDRYYSVPEENCGMTVSGEELLKRITAKRGLTVTCILKFCRRGLWTENSLRFPEGILHEDEAIAYIVLCLAKRAHMLNRQFYRRRLHPGSIMTTTDTYNQKAYGRLKNMELLERFAEKCDLEDVAAIIHRCARNLIQSAINVLDGRKLEMDSPDDSLLQMISWLLDRKASNAQASAQLPKPLMDACRQFQESLAKAKEVKGKKRS